MWISLSLLVATLDRIMASSSPDHSSTQLHSTRHRGAPHCMVLLLETSLKPGLKLLRSPCLCLLFGTSQCYITNGFHTMYSNSPFCPFLISWVIGSLTLSERISESVILICTFLICVYLILFLNLLVLMFWYSVLILKGPSPF